MAEMGRPTKFKEEYCEQAYKLCLLGATDKEIADFFDVCETTITTWKKEHPNFMASLKDGKIKADSEVANKLYNRALGYDYDDVHITNNKGEIIETPIVKHCPPDPTSMIFWLKNRQRAKWTDTNKVEIDGKVQTENPFKDLTTEELRALMEK
jgi:hypothetical protein